MSVFFSNNNIVAPSPLLLNIKLTTSIEKKLFLKDETISMVTSSHSIALFSALGLSFFSFNVT